MRADPDDDSPAENDDDDEDDDDDDEAAADDVAQDREGGQRTAGKGAKQAPIAHIWTLRNETIRNTVKALHL